jgi:hypothetical protein
MYASRTNVTMMWHLCGTYMVVKNTLGTTFLCFGTFNVLTWEHEECEEPVNRQNEGNEEMCKHDNEQFRTFWGHAN